MFSTAPIITDTGKTLLLRAAGGEKITFTKFQVGNGSLSSSETPESATALKHIVLDNIAITKAESTEQDGYIMLTATFDNQTNVQNDFVWTEIGLIAEDEDHVEYLYAYGYDEEYSELIRAGGSDVVAEQTVSIIIAIGDSDNITAYVLPNMTYATKEEFENHIHDYDNPHRVTLQQLGAAAATHTHGAGDIVSGILDVKRGGTGFDNLQDLADALRINRDISFYTGTGANRQDIDLGYKPSKVIIMQINTGKAYGSTMVYCCTSEANIYHGGCGDKYADPELLDDLLARKHGGAGVTNTGFAVGGCSISSPSEQYPVLNKSGAIYLYIAIK